MEGIEATPVVDRKSARVCIVHKLSGFSMPIFEVVAEHVGHRFKMKEKAEHAGVTNAGLGKLLATARAPSSHIIV